MPMYCYVNGEEVLDVQLSMNEEHPKEIQKDGKIFKRSFAREAGKIHIPYQWGTTNNSMIRNTKGPSNRKRFF